MAMKSRVPLAIQEHSGANHSMNLLVLDSDPEALGKRAIERLSELGYQSHFTTDTRVAIDMAARATATIVFCCDPHLLNQLSNLKPGSALFLVSQNTLDQPSLLEAMRAGVQDCWVIDSEDDLAARIKSVEARAKRLVRELNAEVSQMRSELERDQRAGQYIQMGMLPPNPMAIGRFRMEHRVEPSLILSGDFIDYFQITDRYFACYVADVAGHGASSAFVTVLLKNFSRRLRREYRVGMLSNPGQILSWINTELLDQGIDKHVAMFLATVDLKENKLHFANAAHFPPAAMIKDGQTEFLEQKGKPLGLFEGLEFASLHVDFPQGARLVVFSDGVLDLVPKETLVEKEAYLEQVMTEAQSMSDLWSRMDTSRIGADDVSCLIIQHGN